MWFIFISILETDQEKQLVTKLYEEHSLACLHIAIKISKNQALAEDAVHNAFLEIVRKKENFLYLSGSEFRSKIVIIVKNKVIDLLRF